MLNENERNAAPDIRVADTSEGHVLTGQYVAKLYRICDCHGYLCEVRDRDGFFGVCGILGCVCFHWTPRKAPRDVGL